MSTATSPTSSEIAFTGTCRCGAVTYTSTSLPASITACHCVTCRRLSGSPYMTFMSVQESSITFSPAPSLTSVHRQSRHSDLATRTHCTECGAPISILYDIKTGAISITLGSVVEESVKGEFPKLGKHIFLKEKAKIAGLEVPKDGAERWDSYSGPFEEKLADWKKERDGNAGV